LISCVLLTASVAAESGTFFCGIDPGDEVWSSASARHINVTVTVTSCAADGYGDSFHSYVTVYTNNKQMTLYNGQSGTIEDSSATYVNIWETPAYDHNGYAYYGIGGEWSVALVGTGGGEGWDGLGTAMLALGAIAAAIAIVIVVVIIMMSRKKKAAGRPGQYSPMKAAQTQYVQPQYPPDPAPSPVIQPQAAVIPPPQRQPVPSAQFCSNCGAPSTSDGGFCSRCGSAIR